MNPFERPDGWVLIRREDFKEMVDQLRDIRRWYEILYLIGMVYIGSVIGTWLA